MRGSPRALPPVRKFSSMRSDVAPPSPSPSPPYLQRELSFTGSSSAEELPLFLAPRAVQGSEADRHKPSTTAMADAAPFPLPSSSSPDVDDGPPPQVPVTAASSGAAEGAPEGAVGGGAAAGGSSARKRGAADAGEEQGAVKQEVGGQEGGDVWQEGGSEEEEDEEEVEEEEEEEGEGGIGGAGDPLQALAKGNAAFRRNKFAEAIRFYSDALLKQQQPLLQPQGGSAGEGPAGPPSWLPLLLLSNRSAAFCRLSKQLRSIPAAQSERRALFGLDPLSLAQLALKDADKLLKEGGKDWPKAYHRRACALMLLERHNDAHEALLSGLQIEPTNKLLQEAVRELKGEREEGPAGGAPRPEAGSAAGITVSGERGAEGSHGPAGEGRAGRGPSGEDRAGEGGPSKKRAVERSEEFDCSLCLKLLFAPVTTPCGHTFCRACLARAVDHGSKCPVCRIALFVNPSTQPTTVVLSNILEKLFPEEYRERREEVEAEKLLAKETLPLFVMDVVLPRQKMALNIFEPRYRLMVRRAMEGNRTMGMVGFDQATGDISDVACEVEICECEPQPDGRFHLEVEGRRRFKVAKTWEVDGYRMAQVEWVRDQALDPITQPQEAAKLDELAQEAATTARKWVEDVLRSAKGTRRLRLAEYIRSAGDMPAVSQPENLSFWIANLLPTHPRDRLNFLRMTDSSERLTLELGLLKAPERFSSCLVQ